MTPPGALTRAEGFVIDDPHNHAQLAWCLGQLLDGWPGEKRRQSNFLAKNLLNTTHQPGCQQRMASHVEKIVCDTNRLPVQQLFPDSNQLVMDHQFGRDIVFSYCPPRALRCGQRLPIQLTIGRQR